MDFPAGCFCTSVLSSGGSVPMCHHLPLPSMPITASSRSRDYPRSFLLWKHTGSTCTTIYPGLSWKPVQADLLTKINHPAVSIPSWSFLRVLLSCGHDPTAFTGQLSLATMAAGKCVTVLYKASFFLRRVVWRCDFARDNSRILLFSRPVNSPLPARQSGLPGLTPDSPY